MNQWKPQNSDYSAVIGSQNPWHQLGRVPEELAPPADRPLARVLWHALLQEEPRRHQIILGPRRVGKTTVMYQTVQQLLSGEAQIAPNRLWWLRLDHPLRLDWSLGTIVKHILQVAQATPTNPVFVFLDELTYAERWDFWLKTFFDERWPVRVVGTSSATAAIRQRGTESGVGRWDEHFLAPYLFTEYLDLRAAQSSVSLSGSQSDLQCESSLGRTLLRWVEAGVDVADLSLHRRQFLLTGGFPELLLSRRASDDASELLRSQRVLRSNAIEKTLYQDIPQAFSIQDPTRLERLLDVLAGQNSGMLSPQSIASDLGMLAATVERYIGYLERAFLVFTLPNHCASEETVQRRGKRLYFVDGAVRNAALLRGADPINDDREMRQLVENLLASHLRALAHQEEVPLYHWRHKNFAVDLVYDHPDDPLAFEITSATDHHTKGLAKFQERFPKFSGRCYLVSEKQEHRAPPVDQAGHLPLDFLLYAVGRQKQFALANRIGTT